MYLVGCARWAWRARGGRGVRAVGLATLNANFRKKQRINAKSEPSKGSGLAISRRRQIYAMIGVELRTPGDFRQILKTHLHTSPIIVRIRILIADLVVKKTRQMKAA